MRRQPTYAEDEEEEGEDNFDVSLQVPRVPRPPETVQEEDDDEEVEEELEEGEEEEEEKAPPTLVLPPVVKPKDPTEERRVLEEKEKKLAKDLQQQLLWSLSPNPQEDLLAILEHVHALSVQLLA